MNKRVNFEDNIFILMMRIRMIRDIITLDADPELFMEKILDDISFADHILGILLGYLQENQRLIELEELLEHFSEAEWQFSLILKELLDHDGNISVRNNPDLYEKMTVFRNNCMDRRRTANNLSSPGENVASSPIVSSDEITELLKAL